MRTDQLIDRLAADGGSPGKPRLRVAWALAVGWALALAGLAIFSGSPTISETGIAPFAVKFGYTVALTGLSIAAALAAGQPGRNPAMAIAAIAIPVLVVSIVSLLELMSADRSGWIRLLFGTTYFHCVVSVWLASLPPFAAILWAYRALAPTQLRLSGFLVGLSAGSAGAVAFTLYCHETSAAFLLAAYTPALLIPAAAGAAFSRALRW